MIPISLALSIVSAASARATSLTGFTGTQKNHTWKISQNFLTDDRGNPDRTAGGGSRNLLSTQRLISLIPQGKLGLTFKKRPTFFWYVSEPKAKTAEFLLLDENEEEVYGIEFNIPKEKGIFAFTLPDEAPALELNKRYHWHLAVFSNRESIDAINVDGWVERTKPNLSTQIKLNKLEAKKRSKIYADDGIWHDAITHLVQQRCIHPNDSQVMLYWNQLLTSVGLNEIVSEPINNNCKA